MKTTVLIEWLRQHATMFEIFGRLGICFGIMVMAGAVIMCIARIPISIRVPADDDKVVDLTSFFRSIAIAIVCAVGAVHLWAFYFLHPLMLPMKLLFLELLAIGIIVCWVGITSAKAWESKLVQIERECELARTLTYMQGEMTRHQLELLNERIHQTLEPAELEVSETLLKSLSPVLMLFLKKERSLLKWGVAAVNLSKNLSAFFRASRKDASHESAH